MADKIEGVIFDWAGTTVDYGSMAPVDVFDRVFKEEGIDLKKEEINEPMGLDKKTHIRRLLEMPRVNDLWKEVKARDWTEDDVQALYENFEQTLVEVVAEYSVPIDGVVETIDQLRDMDIKIGSTTGYTSEMMVNVKERAKENGYEPDCIITPDLAGGGRPSPYMVFEAMKELGLISVNKIVKVGDTVTDMEEGFNAGVWTVGILEGSNLLGLDEEEFEKIGEEELEELKDEAADKYFQAGADLVIDNIRDLPDAIEEINDVISGNYDLEDEE